MSATVLQPNPDPSISIEDVMRDLEAGRSLPLPPADRLLTLRSRRRSRLGGMAMTLTYAQVRALGAVHPRLARRALSRLWFTPWVHPSSLRPVGDLPVAIIPWTLDVNGREIVGYQAGVGPTVVLIHGWAGRAADWRHVAGALVQSGNRIVVPDLPAHGMTDGHRTDLLELAGATRRVLEHESPRAVVTHSLGFPTLIRAIEEGAPQPGRIVALAPGRRLQHAVETFVDQTSLPAPIADQLRAVIEDRFGDDVWEVLDVDRALPSLTSRGLVVHDIDDEDVALTDAQAIVERWPGAALVKTEGLGHRRVLRDADVIAQVAEELRIRPV